MRSLPRRIANNIKQVLPCVFSSITVEPTIPKQIAFNERQVEYVIATLHDFYIGYRAELGRRRITR